MALRRQSLSPTANLLRNSRLFSLPNPLPQPNVAPTSNRGSSDTATTPYPTHQAIATTPSSLARGDWGLKRPLPARSRILQASDPVVRVKQLDTVEHITDFDSAADHVRTRQKWEEMGIPMLKGMGKLGNTDLTVLEPRSAFEHHGDVTAYGVDEGQDAAGAYLEAIKQSAKRNAENKSFAPFTPPPANTALRSSRRWKHEGPWLPGMSADEFTSYISKEISARRQEFNVYLAEYVKSAIYTKREFASRQSESVPLDSQKAEQEAQERLTISEADIDAGIKKLRRQTAADPLNSDLVQKLIIPFLRLPPIKLKPTSYAQDKTTNVVDKYKFTDETTPSSTHPSAGLGYMRTNAYLANHPILGPQALPTPVTARVLQPRSNGISRELQARLGVGGFAANDEYQAPNVRINAAQAYDLEHLDIKTAGGAKVFVQPQFGVVSNDGRVHLKLTRGYGAEIQVARGELVDRPPQREHVDSGASLASLSSGMGASGVKELDEQSGQAQDFMRTLDGFARAQSQSQTYAAPRESREQQQKPGVAQSKNKYAAPPAPQELENNEPGLAALMGSVEAQTRQ
ncbi:mitochondrial ribosomal protein subunit-domain-containing protein [Massariosphaeria phaeospora]|uniref:Mitochondrial ribosomal protein subunit-domain-containing protein n=1 Tax=Massariosphaeria phaeospora TaxID=100035 RepID=A0A7C8IIL4_9PLEO|nr:mitochondrial ribosomal protein subunit-domain-containing protein [Massariosphaeria phaeospora]